MRISDVDISDSPRGARLSAHITWEHSRHASELIEFVYRGLAADAITGAGDAVLASMLIPAMAVGEDIRLDVPVSARLLESVPKIVFIHREWYPRWHRTRVDAPPVEEQVREPSEVASFFSGGLDSFFTILRPREDPVTLLFTILGFDLRFEKRASIPSILPRLQAAADAMGKRLIVVDSNAFEIGHKYVFKAEHHGGFLAAVALAAGGMIRRCFIPASWALWRVPPFGSHPATDPLWSTERLEFVHDAIELSRVEKGLAIAGEQVVLDHLRVCVRRPDLYNCGRCVKCVSTILNLYVAGTLDRCATLGDLDIRTIRRTPVSYPYEEVFREVMERIEDPELERAMQHAIRRSRLRRAAEPLLDPVRRRRLRARLRAYEAAPTGGDDR